MEIIPIMDRVVSEEYIQSFGSDEISGRLQVRTYNLYKKARMRELNPEDIGQLLTLKGALNIYLVDNRTWLRYCMCDILSHTTK